MPPIPIPAIFSFSFGDFGLAKTRLGKIATVEAAAPVARNCLRFIVFILSSLTYLTDLTSVPIIHHLSFSRKARL
jgi:hypothetical protein